MIEVRWLAGLRSVDAGAWDALHDGRNPFVAHAFLSGLEQHGCLREDWGWVPHHATLWEGNALLAAAPGYLKSNSHGEFVFDHAWAHAYAQHGRDYFPKWLGAVPYSPVTGPRLLAPTRALGRELLAAVIRQGRDSGISSAHINFHAPDEDAVFGPDWLARSDVQYHWRNESGWQDFDGFLGALDHKHRKNIRQERAKVQRAGISFRVLQGDEASDEDLATMFAFYLLTFRDYGNSPALTLDFLRHLAREMPRNLVMFLACRDGSPIAGALCLRGGNTLYGRYWGASETSPGLHFETCYYQGIEYCLREGLTAFEPGAQGEHKIARGFLPTFVHSRHWIADAEFADALRGWCMEETRSVERYAETLAAHSPFKTGSNVDANVGAS
ncbi:MAG: GNAT family N-acetyltransferase [Pseudoxanthomonas sp.]